MLDSVSDFAYFRNILALSIYVGSVFVLQASDQPEKAIQHCETAIYLARLLISQMPSYITPYMQIFSILPLLKSSRLSEQIQSVRSVRRISARLIRIIY